jgi:hypothetical protein
MSDQPKRTVPVWVFVVTFVVVAAMAGALAWLAANSKPTVPGPGASATPTATVPATTAVTPTTTVVTTPTVAPTPTATPATVKEPSLVTKVTWSASKGYRITVDYVQILTGKAAADAATAAGEESPPPNDYFIVNTNPKLRTFSLPKGTPVTVLGWGGTDSTAKKKISVGQFMDIMPGGTNPQDEYVNAYYYVTVKAGTTVTKVEQIFFP